MGKNDRRGAHADTWRGCVLRRDDDECAERRRYVRFASVCAILLALLVEVVAVPGFAAPGALRGPTWIVSATAPSPLVALIAGILILIVPHLSNSIVALYLIAVGLIGFFGH